MLDTPQSTLRARLRKETAADHERVDSLFSTWNLAEPEGLALFFAAHLVGFGAVRRAMGDVDGWVTRDMVDEMCAALSTDLHTLNRQRTLPTIDIEPVSRHATDHIVLGSRLGTAVLKRDWAKSTDPIVSSASSYFGLPTRSDLWRAHCDEVAALSGASSKANEAVVDARRLFRTFEQAYHVIC